MALSFATDIFSGTVFGSALVASGVYRPSVIISQMRLENFHMLQVFLGASATSAALVRLTSWLKYCDVPPRTPATLGRLGPYTGNIVGGLMIGIAMAITGACPGTSLVQAAIGVPLSLYVVCGGVLGGMLFGGLQPKMNTIFSRDQARGASDDKTTDVTVPPSDGAYTIHDKLGYSVDTVLLAYEAMCVLMIVLATTFAPTRPTYLSPLLGALAIGGAQACSILLSRKTLGVSSAYAQIGDMLRRLVSPSTQSPAPASYGAARFAMGVMLGAKMMVTHMPMLAVADAASDASRLSMVLGGAVMVFGARLAGGCTSGHGISGMATFGVASFVTVGAMFAGGITWAMLV